MNRNLKIAILNDMSPVAGITTYVYNIFLNLKKHNISTDFYQFDSTNFYINKADVIIKKGINFRIKENNGLNALLGLNYRAFKKLNSEYDIILISGPTLNKVKKYYNNLIHIGHDLYYLFKGSKPLIYALYMRKQYNLFKRAQNIIVNSQYTKNDFIKYLDIDENRIDVVYPAINNEIFYPGKSNLRGSLNINNEDILLLNVAHDSKPNKNVITVLKVLRTLPQNYKLIRIGNNSNTLNLIKEWNLEERVILFENIDSKKLGEVYRASDIFIFPSLFEGFGIPVAEAMASGLPVIVSNKTSLPEVVGNAGLIFDPYDIEGMKEAILKITKDRELYETYRKISIERAKIFSYENQFKSLMDVFEKFIQTK